MAITDEPVAADTATQPQPLGLFDGPAGLVLVGPGEGRDELLAELAAGRVPERWPAVAGPLRAALDGDTDGALDLLGDGPVDAVNRFVLGPTEEHLAEAERVVDGEPGLEVVVAAAAYASGLRDDPPSPDGAEREYAVLALTVRAARALEFKDPTSALRLLQAAVPPASAAGPVLQARVLGMLADQEGRRQVAVGSTAAIDHYAEAIGLLEGTDHDELRAGFHLERAVLLHQLADGGRHHLVEAIRGYQSALLVMSEERDPERFALANMNIGIAILALPMTQASDQVKLGVAVQSLRAALRVYRPETHPYEWSSCQMNLANALQYLPSTHREENLQEAVELYEEVLGVRSAASDPAGYARVLANQANALAHLAVFDHAEAKYGEARRLFAAAGDDDAVEVVDRQLAEIATTREAAR